MSSVTAGEYGPLIQKIRGLFGTEEFIPLHAPVFGGREKELLNACIDSTFVSSVGEYVGAFEESLARYVGAKHAVAVVNGTQALFVALQLVGVGPGQLVLTQGLTFAATGNAIWYTGAEPYFLDADPETLGLDPVALERYLKEETLERGGKRYDKTTGQGVGAVVPMHTFGFPVKIRQIAELCAAYGVPLVEDAAESLGSLSQGRHTGTFGTLGIFSFNGNKIITTGGGGMIVTDDPALAKAAKHLTTTAKRPHKWEFFHDQLGYNFRLPNLNAALGVAQMEQMDRFVESKRKLALEYQGILLGTGLKFLQEAPGDRANYWLNAVELPDLAHRERFLEQTNEAKVMTRPLWTPLNLLPYNQQCRHDGLATSLWLYERMVNLPSSVRS